ncbi:Multifunctional CCA protein [Candidatus Erwinia haradaeae]|uniref:CCA-adding enzyme n=1 Tax=Candidatus Erwinia haradaeae TaxID=1922217 RepID=A0A451DJK0_9GAMM|nr:multifunctional CCA addition/repair protein [Candidatus Erwinia haradaeae]VFP86861.1 Multifunctional CCA protein [Candidatus Erwinia haradaeae]
METYLVGGAVRDQLLYLPVKDKDWVVVGGSPKKMLTMGYKQVGRNFPVFLHPITHEEYALARVEQKSGRGYTGFACYANSDVTLKQDLARRDLTINAIALDKHGTYYDPYGGRIDLQKRILRHISSAFCEDPLRVLRVARFSAYLANLKFRVSHETLALMKEVVQSGELSYLSPERIWNEMDLALKTSCPQVFFQVLKACGALKELFPELDSVYYSISAKKKKRSQVITHKYNTFITLSKVAQYSSEVEIRFAALCYDLTKSLITQENAANDSKGDVPGITITSIFCKRLRLPREYRELALLVFEFYSILHNIHFSSPKQLLTLFNRIDAWRKPYRIQQIALILDIESRTPKTCLGHLSSKGECLHDAWQVAKSVSTQAIISAGFVGYKVSEELCRRRLSALTAWRNS